MRRPANVGDPEQAEAMRDFDLTDIHDLVAGLNGGQRRQKEINNRTSSFTKDLLVEQAGILFESLLHQRTRAAEAFE